MKQILIALTSLLVCVLISCNGKQKDNKAAEVKTTAHPSIDGNWETVLFEMNGNKLNQKGLRNSSKCFMTPFSL